MICQNCGEHCGASHTYADPSGEAITRRRECSSCGWVFTTVEKVAFVNPDRGFGASAVSKQIAEGSTQVELSLEASAAPLRPKRIGLEEPSGI